VVVQRRGEKVASMRLEDGKKRRERLMNWAVHYCPAVAGRVTGLAGLWWASLARVISIVNAERASHFLEYSANQSE
jgi:hypothetical protein